MILKIKIQPKSTTKPRSLSREHTFVHHGCILKIEACGNGQCKLIKISVRYPAYSRKYTLEHFIYRVHNYSRKNCTLPYDHSP